jgi:hypothetical protein
MDPDPDPGGPKTYGSGTGSPTLATLLLFIDIYDEANYKLKIATIVPHFSFTRKLLSLCSGDDLPPECRVQFLLGLQVEVGEGPVQHLAHTLPRLQHVV